MKDRSTELAPSLLNQSVVRLRCALLLAILLFGASGFAQIVPSATSTREEAAQARDDADRSDKKARRGDVLADSPGTETQVEQLIHAIERLPIAAGLACVLALRPRRRGTPARQLPVIQTQIILAIVGAVVMLVVGSSLARAFGIVGAAGLVRYRAKIADPKDAGVMLSTLAVGLASGVGLWMLATFATMFVLGVLWTLESFEPKAQQLFALKVKAKNPAALKGKLEQVFGRHRVGYELRTASTEELCYEVRVPIDRKTDGLSTVILGLDPQNATAVEWEEKEDRK